MLCGWRIRSPLPGARSARRASSPFYQDPLCSCIFGRALVRAAPLSRAAVPAPLFWLQNLCYLIWMACALLLRALARSSARAGLAWHLSGHLIISIFMLSCACTPACLLSVCLPAICLPACLSLSSSLPHHTCHHTFALLPALFLFLWLSLAVLWLVPHSHLAAAHITCHTHTHT